jgi:hypothetical protein
MIIHGGYAKFLRGGAESSYNDIDLFSTTEDLDNLCALFSDENYVYKRGQTPVPNREVIILFPRSRNFPLIKFDAEVVSKSLHDQVWDLPDTEKTMFMGLQVGVVSGITDMIIKEEVMHVSDPKHAVDVAAYRDELGDVDTTMHEPFRASWAAHIAEKYGSAHTLQNPAHKHMQ